MPNYADGVNRLRIAELEARATNFADNYKRGRYSIIFISNVAILSDHAMC